MGDPTTEFFEDLARRGFDSRVVTMRGTVSFDFRGDGQGPGQWFVVVDRGQIGVSREPRSADCIVRVGREAFDRMIADGDNAVTALLRGAATADGDLGLLLQFQRLFPGQPGRDPRQRQPTSKTSGGGGS